jgi:hypothetical protein
LAKVDAYANETGISFALALRRAAEAGVGAAGVRGINTFMQLLDECQAMLEEGPGPVLRHAWNEAGTLPNLLLKTRLSLLVAKRTCKNSLVLPVNLCK